MPTTLSSWPSHSGTVANWELPMPTIHLELHPGRTLEQKRYFVRKVTEITCETLVCPIESVDVLITEVSREHWAKGGQLTSDKDAARKAAR